MTAVNPAVLLHNSHCSLHMPPPLTLSSRSCRRTEKVVGFSPGARNEGVHVIAKGLACCLESFVTLQGFSQLILYLFRLAYFCCCLLRGIGSDCSQLTSTE